MVLKYNDSGKFRIVQFTDTHVGSFPFNEKDSKTVQLVKKALEVLKPNLIIHTGDIVWSEGVESIEMIFTEFIKCFDAYKIPMAITFGNHDSEEYITRPQLQKLFDNTLETKIQKTNSFIIDDKESYTIEIYSDKKIANVIFIIDSGDYDPFEIGLYGWVLPEQVEWFRSISNYYKNKNNYINNLVDKKTNIIFQHIPTMEFWEASKKKNIIKGKCYETNDKICSPKINTGLFANALIDQKVWGIVAGHDHDNNFDSMVNGLHLTYGQVSGYNTYGRLKRGVRVFDFELEPFKILTYTITADELNKK